MNVSFIIPAYNAAKTIQDALGSVAAQTVPAWEAVVVDDGSTDNTSKIVKRLAKQDPRISLIQKKNGGESDARNAAVASARHDWLAFLDADDWVSPFYLRRMTDELSAHPELDAVHCGSVRVALDGTFVTDDYQPPAGDLFPILARRAAFPVNACIVRKALVESVGMFDTSLKKSADWDLWQRIARAGACFGAVRETLAYYRMTPNSSSLGARQLLRDGLTVLKRGHAPDPRVQHPHPDYLNGLQTDRADSQVFYLLSWCAGLSVGIRKDARPLIQLVKEHRFDSLYPVAIAQCIFEAATLPLCQPRNAWDELWPDVYSLARKFLIALEKQSGTQDLAKRAFMELMKLTLRHSTTWGPVMREAEEQQAELQGERDRLRLFCDDLENQKRALEEEHERKAQERTLQEDLERTVQLREQTEIQKRMLEDELERARQIAERQEQTRLSLEAERARWQGLFEETETRKRMLQDDLDGARQLTDRQAHERLALEADRAKWQQMSEELELREAATRETLHQTRLAAEVLEKAKAALENEVSRWQRMVDAVEDEKAQVDSSRREWWRVAEQRAMLIAEMEDSLWFRIGARLRILDLHKKSGDPVREDV